VFVNDEAGVDRFWGFTVALIHLSPLLDAAGFPGLVKSHDYELSRIHPDTGNRHVFARSSNTGIQDGAAIDVAVPNATWTLTLIPKSGWVPTWLRLLLTVVPLTAAVGSSVLFAAYQIQRRKKSWTEKARQESEERLRQVAESIREVFWLLDHETHQVLYVNPAYEEIMGSHL
jgi:PAS domain-containing protein